MSSAVKALAKSRSGAEQVKSESAALSAAPRRRKVRGSAAATEVWGDTTEPGFRAGAVFLGSISELGIGKESPLDDGKISRGKITPGHPGGSSVEIRSIKCGSSTKGLTSHAWEQAKVEKDIRTELPRLSSFLRNKHLQCPRLIKAIHWSVLLALVTSVVVVSSGGDQLLIVWRLSMMICCGSFFWTNFLGVMECRTVFLCISYGSLFAHFAHYALSPSTGVIVVHLNSHFAAGLLGFALAECCQRQGIEKSYLAVPVPTNDKEVRRLRFLRFIGGLTLAGPILGLAGCMALLIWYSASYGAAELVLMLLVLLISGVVLGIVIVAMFELRGALITPDGFGFVVVYFGFVAFTWVFSPEVLGDNAGMVITWLAVLPLSGLLGYCLCVHASYKKLIMRSYRSKDLEPVARSEQVNLAHSIDKEDQLTGVRFGEGLAGKPRPRMEAPRGMEGPWQPMPPAMEYEGAEPPAMEGPDEASPLELLRQGQD